MSNTRKFKLAALAALAVIALWPATSFAGNRKNAAEDEHPGTGDQRPVILRFNVMYAVDEFLVGDSNPVRGIAGDGLPWEIERAKGALDIDGRLTIKVRGLVLAEDPSVPIDLQGINPDATFRAVVSCQTDDGTGHLVDRNIFTDPSAADSAGDSNIEARVTLPEPCISPVIFIVAGDRDQWFSITGFEEEEE